jgi:hypothetical protein
MIEIKKSDEYKRLFQIMSTISFGQPIRAGCTACTNNILEFIEGKLSTNNYAIDKVLQEVFPNDNNNKALKLYIMNYDK